jgi:hypothetical protein
MHVPRPLVFVSSLALAAGCAATQPRAAIVNTPSYAAAPPAPASNAQTIAGAYVPSGTHLVAQLDNTIATGQSYPGQPFSARVVTPLLDADGREIVPEGARLVGRVTAADPGHRYGQGAVIGLAIEGISTPRGTTPLSAQVVGADLEASRRGVRVSHVLGGAAGGALLGGILGGGRGALIGAGAGAGGGALLSLGTADTNAALPAGAAIEVVTNESVPVFAFRNPSMPSTAVGGGPWY